MRSRLHDLQQGLNLIIGAYLGFEFVTADSAANHLPPKTNR